MHTEAITLPLLEHSTPSPFNESATSMQGIIDLLQHETMQVGLVVITIQFERMGQKSREMQSMQHFLEKLRPLVRKADTVLQQEQSYYFLLVGANQQGAGIVKERLWEALLWAVHNMNDEGLLRPRCIAAGYSAYPDSCTTPGDCLKAACDPTIRFVTQREQHEQEVASQALSALKKSELPLLARQLGIPYLSLLPRKLPGRVLRLIRPELAQELRCYPLGRERDTLTVAMTDPQDRESIERLQRETGLRIFPVLTRLEELQDALERLV